MKKLFTLLAITISFNMLANELSIHVITPRYQIEWNSPRSLAISTAKNTITKDYAPIGHLAVEIKCTNKNRFGINHVLTGMEREDKEESKRITLEKKLGLSSLVYPFNGALQSGRTSQAEINQARQENRLRTIIIPTSSERCDQMLDFLDNWISAGSYKVYGGGKDVTNGEGAGCADFAMEFFKIATQSLPPYEWYAQIRIPLSLMGNEQFQVPFQNILLYSTWAKKGEPSRFFSIPDMNLMTEWIDKRLMNKKKEYLYTDHIFFGGIIAPSNQSIMATIKEHARELYPPRSLRPMFYHYPTKRSQSSIWQEIKAKSL